MPINRQKQAGHIPGTAQAANRAKQNKPTSLFNDTDQETVDAFVREAYNKGTPVAGRPNLRDFEFDEFIGVDVNGASQQRIRVHMDGSGNIHGHPAGPGF